MCACSHLCPVGPSFAPQTHSFGVGNSVGAGVGVVGLGVGRIVGAGVGGGGVGAAAGPAEPPDLHILFMLLSLSKIGLRDTQLALVRSSRHLTLIRPQPAVRYERRHAHCLP